MLKDISLPGKKIILHFKGTYIFVAAIDKFTTFLNFNEHRQK